MMIIKSIIFGLVAVAAASDFHSGRFRNFGTQREVRVNGDNRIFVRGPRKLLVFAVPKDNPKNLRIVAKDADVRMVEVVELGENREVIKKLSFESQDDEKFEDVASENTVSNKNNPQGPTNNQMKVLLPIFRKYQGFIGEFQFYHILKEVKELVGREELSSVIYDFLKEHEVKPLNTVDESSGKARAEEENDTKQEQEMTTLTDDTGKTDIEEIRKNRNTEAEQDAFFRQILWIQELLKNRQATLPTQGLYPQVQTEQALKFFSDQATKSKNNELTETIVLTKIQETEGIIGIKELLRQNLQMQQQFLSFQKLQLKLTKRSNKPMRNRDESEPMLMKVLSQIKGKELKLIDKQLDVQKTIIALEQKLVNELGELKEIVKKEEP